MNDTNYNTIDLNLLAVFVLLMQERSVTRVADRLSLGQPAVSHALARLRKQIGDPLFVRAGRLMEPTPRACVLFATVDPAIKALEAAVRAVHSFDPLTCNRQFRIAMSDDVQIAFLPYIFGQLAEQMPLAQLVVIQSNYRRAMQTLEHKEASMVIGYLDKLPAEARIRKIRRVGYRLLQGRPAADARPGSLDLDTYCRLPHLLVTYAGDLVGYIDETLQALGKHRTIHLSVPTFAILPHLLKGSDLLATVPDYVATMLAAVGHLDALPLPFTSPEFDLSMAWSAATDRDPAEQYLRNLILNVLQNPPPVT